MGETFTCTKTDGKKKKKGRFKIQEKDKIQKSKFLEQLRVYKVLIICEDSPKLGKRTPTR